MNRNKKLLKNTFIITIGKICTQLITFLLLPLYTGILSTREYGTIDLLNTLITLLLPIITLQIEQAVFRELLEWRNCLEEKKEIISTAIFLTMLQCVLYSVLFLSISPFIHNQYKFYLFINVVAAIFSSLFLQIARGIGDNKKYAIGSFISAVSTVILNIFFLIIINLRVDGMLISTMLGQIICCVYLFFNLRIYKYVSKKSFNKQISKKILKYSIPLIPNQISWWIFNVSDRIIVSIILGLEKNGLLSAASKFSSLYIMIYSIINMSITEIISLHINDCDIKEYLNKLFNTVIHFFLSLCILLIACMPLIYPILINKKFNDGYGLIPILLISSFFNVIGSLIGVVYVAKKNTKAIASTSIIAALINILSHLILINYIGLYAAAVSTLLSFVIMTIYRLYNIKKYYFSIEFDRKKIFFGILLLSIFTILFYLNNIIINLISSIISIIMLLFLNKDYIMTIVKLIEKRN